MTGIPARKAAGEPPKTSRFWLQGAICGALLAFATPTALLLGILLAPAVVSAVMERDGLRGTARAVALCGAAASLAPLWRLWMQGGQMSMALNLLAEPVTLLVAWGSGACAWAACQVVPVIVKGFWDVREAARAKGIEAELARYREDWDLSEETEGLAS